MSELIYWAICLFLEKKNANDLLWWCLIYHLHGVLTALNTSVNKSLFTRCKTLIPIRTIWKKTTAELNLMSMAMRKTTKMQWKSFLFCFYIPSNRKTFQFPAFVTWNWYFRCVESSDTILIYETRVRLIEDKITSLMSLQLFTPPFCTRSGKYENQKGNQIYETDEIEAWIISCHSHFQFFKFWVVRIFCDSCG